jgi:hypothetical protein
MFGLKKSTVKAAAGYQIYDIPHTDKTKIATHDDGDYITVIGIDSNDMWYRLGDREDLVPEELKEFDLTCLRSADKGEQKKFVKKVLKCFAG